MAENIISTQNTVENNNEKLKAFRTGRQLLSSIACLILAYFFVRYFVTTTKFLNQIFAYIISVGLFYCAFGIAHWLNSLLFRKKLIKGNNIISLVIDTIIYLCLSVGAVVLIGFLCNMVNWLGLLFCIGGVLEVIYDIRCISQLEVK